MNEWNSFCTFPAGEVSCRDRCTKTRLRSDRDWAVLSQKSFIILKIWFSFIENFSNKNFLNFKLFSNKFTQQQSLNVVLTITYIESQQCPVSDSVLTCCTIKRKLKTWCRFLPVSRDSILKLQDDKIKLKGTFFIYLSLLLDLDSFSS